MVWADLDAELAAAPGTVSVYVGRLNRPPAYTRLSQTPHYAASTMKVTLLAALHRAAETGAVDVTAPVPVQNRFASAASGAPAFACAPDYDNDDAVWGRLGGVAPLAWLAERMIIRSSNLAANLVLAHVGLAAADEVWRRVGARHSATRRGIEDFAARDAGLDNQVTAADLAVLFAAIVTGASGEGGVSEGGVSEGGVSEGGVGGQEDVSGEDGIGGHRLAGPAACARMLDVLLAQERREDLPAGLPAGLRIAHKNGWVRGVRHWAGVVLPEDAPPYAVAVCTTAEPAGAGEHDAVARTLIAHVSQVAWRARHRLADQG